MYRGVIFEALCTIYIFKNLYVETAEICAGMLTETSKYIRGFSVYSLLASSASRSFRLRFAIQVSGCEFLTKPGSWCLMALNERR